MPDDIDKPKNLGDDDEPVDELTWEQFFDLQAYTQAMGMMDTLPTTKGKLRAVERFLKGEKRGR